MMWLRVCGDLWLKWWLSQWKTRWVAGVCDSPESKRGGKTQQRQEVEIHKKTLQRTTKYNKCYHSWCSCCLMLQLCPCVCVCHRVGGYVITKKNDGQHWKNKAQVEVVFHVGSSECICVLAISSICKWVSLSVYWTVSSLMSVFHSLLPFDNVLPDIRGGSS